MKMKYYKILDTETKKFILNNMGTHSTFHTMDEAEEGKRKLLIREYLHKSRSPLEVQEQNDNPVWRWLPGGYGVDIVVYPQLKKHWDKKVIKEFSCGFGYPWSSWQDIGTHKNVGNWCITEDGYAIGFNENPTSIGWNFPVKKLSKEQLEKYMSHTMTYEEYHNL